MNTIRMVIATTFAFSSFFTPTHGALARDKSTPQSITSAPLSGGYFRCTFQNRADGDLGNNVRHGRNSTATHRAQ